MQCISLFCVCWCWREWTTMNRGFAEKVSLVFAKREIPVQTIVSQCSKDYGRPMIYSKSSRISWTCLETVVSSDYGTTKGKYLVSDGWTLTERPNQVWNQMTNTVKSFKPVDKNGHLMFVSSVLFKIETLACITIRLVQECIFPLHICSLCTCILYLTGDIVISGCASERRLGIDSRVKRRGHGLYT